MAKWLKDFYKEYMEEVLEEGIMPSSNVPVVIGGVYFGSLASLNPEKPRKPLYFVIIDKVEDGLYEVLKVSDWSVFARNTDVILDIGAMKVMIETDNNFYLTENEISKFMLIHQITEEDLKDILLFRDGEKPSRPLRIGVTPIYREDIRNQFNETEFRQIEDLHFRVFAILQDPEEEEPLEEE